MSKSKKALIITTSGGSGHIQAAKAVEQEILFNDPNYIIIQKELFIDWGFKSLCKLGIGFYNRLQRKGSVFAREAMVKLLILADIFFWPKFFVSILIFLFKNDVDRVIDTQPVGNSALIKALRIYNKVKNRNLIVEKIIVDLPTKRNKHFFNGLKRLSKKDKKFIKIISLEPLLEDEKKEEDFWQKNVGFSKKDIIYKKYVVRRAFKEFQDKPLNKDLFTLSITADKNADLIRKILKETGTIFLHKENKINFSIGKNDRLTTILLGSQPPLNITKNYIVEMIELMKNIQFDHNHYLVVFCAKEENFLFQILDLVKNDENYPTNLKIIPMSFQDDKVIASLFYRSDITITKSGGSTILELLCVSNGKSLIHTDALNNNLLKGIPYWEAGNALYLQEKKGADFVNPKTISKFAKSIF